MDSQTMALVQAPAEIDDPTKQIAQGRQDADRAICRQIEGKNRLKLRDVSSRIAHKKNIGATLFKPAMQALLQMGEMHSRLATFEKRQYKGFAEGTAIRLAVRINQLGIKAGLTILQDKTNRNKSCVFREAREF